MHIFFDPWAEKAAGYRGLAIFLILVPYKLTKKTYPVKSLGGGGGGGGVSILPPGLK